MRYTIVNPHDDYGLDADRDDVALVAALLLDTRGAYSATRDGFDPPLGLFGLEPLDTFCQNTFGCTLDTLVGTVTSEHRAALTATLDSVIVDPDGFDRLVASVGGTRDALADGWHDARRTSAVDLRARAQTLAGRLRTSAPPGR